MKSIKLSLVAALLATTGVVSSVSADELEVSANVALTSNYVWRGMTQTGNSPAIQGGFDIGYAGAYAGVWASNVNFNSAGSPDSSIETDLYLGYANSIDKFSYDVGFIYYTYANDSDPLNFGELYASVGYDFDVLSVSAMYGWGIDTNDVPGETAATASEPGDVWELGVSVPLPMDITLDATYGEYDNSGTPNVTQNEFGDYYLVGVSKSFGKFDLSLAYTEMDYEAAGTNNESNLVATIGTSF